MNTADKTNTPNGAHTSDSARTLTLFDQCPAHGPAKFTVWEVPVFRVELVKERSLSGLVVTMPADVAALLAGFLDRCDREHFVVVMVSAAGQMIGVNTVSIGSLTATIVNARAVFKPAILSNARSIVVAHNHPSGNLEPSREDVAVSKALAEAGRLSTSPTRSSSGTRAATPRSPSGPHGLVRFTTSTTELTTGAGEHSALRPHSVYSHGNLHRPELYHRNGSPHER